MADNQLLASPLYQLDYQRGLLIVKQKKSDRAEKWVIRYRYFLSPLPDTLAFKPPSLIADTLLPVDYFKLYDKQNYAMQDFLDDSKLKKSGSITRGLTVGNATGTTVTSGMRLQLEGDLGDGLQIVGAITDDNIPIQPDGTTQQISDLDKVFIQLRKNAYNLTIGDYEVQQKNTRLGDLYRNVQGLKVGYETAKTKASVSGAVAKGKFHSNSFNGTDGMAGPYFLTGKSGEKFFMVLAGSEKVYLNGKLLVRGESNDYVMDYNTAQITFTARNVITNISRIVVDFEYTDRFFNRSLVFAAGEHKLLQDKLQLRASYARDADNPNAPFDNRDEYLKIKDSLALAGDAVNSTYYTYGVIPDSNYNRNQVFYFLQDTLYLGQTYQIYVQTDDSLRARYRIFFTFVGSGKGRYKRDVSGFNRYVFKWAAPDSLGRPTGDYEPIKAWVLPRKLEVVNVAAKYQLSKKAELYTEIALSNEDKNMLSALQDKDNAAFGNLTGLKLQQVKLADSLQWETDVSLSYIQARYNNIDRVYKAEYGRVWNFDDVAGQRADETILAWKNGLAWKEKYRLQTENAIRNTGTGKTAFRQVYTLQKSGSKGLTGTYTYTRIGAREDSIQRTGTWQRHEGDVGYAWRQMRWGTEIWIEDKAEKLAGEQAAGSFAFYDLKPYWRKGGENSKFSFDFSVNYRYDRQFLGARIREKSAAFTHFYKLTYSPAENFKLQNITSYRMLNILDTAFVLLGETSNRSLNENLQLTAFTKNRMLYANFLYEVTSEQVAQRDVLFLRVNPGQGEYQWIDANEDGVQNINEFVLSVNPLQADYIRVILPTQRFVPSTKPAMQASVRVDLRKLYAKSNNPFKETLRNFKTFSTFRVYQNKQRENRFSTYFIRLQTDDNDTTLIDMSYNFRQEFTFFQNSPTGDLRVAYQLNRNRQFLSTGTETRHNRAWTLAPRFSLADDKSLEAETNLGYRYTQAQNFPARNFNIRFFDTYPKLNWQLNRKLRLTGGYTYKHKRSFSDSLTLNSRVGLHKITLENRWNIKDRNNLNTKLELVAISQRNTGLGPNFTANYELLESLQPGFNAVWQTFLTYYIFKDLEMGVTYEGRAAAGQKVVHTGRVQLRAVF